MKKKIMYFGVIIKKALNIIKTSNDQLNMLEREHRARFADDFLDGQHLFE